MRRLLIGPAGCGKTNRVLGEFQQALASGDPLARDLFFILPSAEHTERTVTLLLQQGLKGFFHSRVTTLSQLTRGLFEIGRENLISESARFAILSSLLAEREWPHFQEVRSLPGFHKLLSHFLIEVKDAFLSAEAFRERMNKMKQIEPDLAAKYEALAGIYESYQEILKAQGLCDVQDALAVYRGRKQKGFHPQKLKRIWLDGFFDFSNLQFEYLKELCDLADDVTITLTADRVREPLFQIVKETESRLVNLGFQVEFMKTGNQRATHPALVYLEKNLFSEKPAAKIPEPEESLAVFEAVGVQGEIEMIAREIDRLYKQGGYRFSDFAILMRTIGSYESAVRSVFNRFEIPVEIHERERLKLAPLVQTAVNLLKIFIDGWKREDLLRFLKSSYVRNIAKEVKDEAGIHELENGALREGILAGRENWLRNWKWYEGKPGFPEFKKQLLETLGGLEDNFRKTESFEGLRQQFTRALHQTFGIVRHEDSLSEAVRRDASSERSLDSILDEIRLHLKLKGQDKITFEDFAEQFFRLVEIDLYSLHDRDKNRVQVYDISLARQKEYRVVFVAGLLERNFPIQMKEDPILSDWERDLLNTGLAISFPLRLPRQALERYFFYLAVTRARERVIFTFPHLDREGKEALASFYLDEVWALFPGMKLKKQRLNQPYPDLLEAANLRELELAIAGGLWDEQNPHRTLIEEAAGILLREDKAKAKFEKARFEIKPQLHDSRIQEGDFFRTALTSPTRLEDYGKCAFKYFAGKVLKLQDLEDEVNIRHKGSILHEVLEHFFAARLKTKKEWTPGQIRDFVLRELEAGLEKYPLVNEKKYQYDLDVEEMKSMLFRFLDAELERLKESPLQPAYFEFSFGKSPDDPAPPLILKDENGNEVAITGKIDRIDVDAKNQFGLVVDYKRSTKFNRKNLENGTALQLPIYLTAIHQFLHLNPVGGQLYSIKDVKAQGFYHADHAESLLKLSSRASKLSVQEFDRILKQGQYFAQMFIQDMKKMNIDVRPRTKEVCEFCSFTPICRIQKWKIAEIAEGMREQDSKRLKEGKDAAHTHSG